MPDGSQMPVTSDPGGSDGSGFCGHMYIAPPTYIIKNNTINKSSSNSSYRQWVKFVQALYLKRDNNNSYYNSI